MKKKLILLMLVASMLTALLAGCGNNGNEGSDNGNTLTVLNYGKYIDEGVLKQFETMTGIDVKYEEYESPEEMYTKYKTGAIDYDVICTSEYIIQKLIEEDEVLEMDYASLSNYGNLDQDILDMAKVYDPNNTYTVPYFYGTLGICYDTTKVTEEEVSSWNVLWSEAHHNEIIMMNSVRDSFVPALKLCGYGINESNEGKLREALGLLDAQFDTVYAYFVDEIGDEMISGNAHMALVYSGEAGYAMDFNENLAYTIPEEGSNLWIDSWFIPKTSKNTDAAMAFINFMCDPDAAMANFEYVYYASPIVPVVEALDEETRNNEAIIPSKASLEKCEIFTSIDPETSALLNHLWQELKSRTVN
ncbi:MAG: ABC transporter substrate-binding protein [Agathobacter sp.]|nr:ABC transporter substrate-binding protein [Agathobacter sp.]